MTTFPNGIVPHIRSSVNRFSSLLDALESLVFDYGAHLIPVQPDKSPAHGFRKDWQHKSPSWGMLRIHAARGGYFGLIPYSLGLCVLDWDDDDLGAAAAFTIEQPPALMLPTASFGHWHFYYETFKPRPNARFTWDGKDRGDVRSAKGYVVMWGNAPQQLSALMNGQLPSWQQKAFPEHLLGAPAVPILDGIADAPQLAPDPTLAPDTPFKSYTTPLSLESIDWGAVKPGSRNLTLFNGLRFLAYNSPVSLYPSRESWFAELRARAFEWAALMPDRRGFPDSEVRATAESVAAYTWQRRHAVRDNKRADSDVQRRRGVRSGEKRRWKERERNDQIKDMLERGMTKAAIARQAGLSRRQVIKLAARFSVREQPADIQ